MLKRAQIFGLDTFWFGRIKCENFKFTSSESSSSVVVASPQHVPPGKWRATFEKCPGYDGRLLLDVFHHLKAYTVPTEVWAATNSTSFLWFF